MLSHRRCWRCYCVSLIELLRAKCRQLVVLDSTVTIIIIFVCICVIVLCIIQAKPLPTMALECWQVYYDYDYCLFFQPLPLPFSKRAFLSLIGARDATASDAIRCGSLALPSQHYHYRFDSMCCCV